MAPFPMSGEQTSVTGRLFSNCRQPSHPHTMTVRTRHAPGTRFSCLWWKTAPSYVLHRGPIAQKESSGGPGRSSSSSCLTGCAPPAPLPRCPECTSCTGQPTALREWAAGVLVPATPSVSSCAAAASAGETGPRVLAPEFALCPTVTKTPCHGPRDSPRVGQPQPVSTLAPQDPWRPWPWVHGSPTVDSGPQHQCSAVPLVSFR